MKTCKKCKTVYKKESVNMVFKNSNCTVCKFCKEIRNALMDLNINKKGV